MRELTKTRIRISMLAITFMAVYLLVSTLDYQDQRASECYKVGKGYSGATDSCTKKQTWRN